MTRATLKSAACAALILSSGCGRRPSVEVSSVPPGAAVWVGTQVLGPAPQRLEVGPEETLEIRVVLPGYREWKLALNRGSIPLERTLTARLEPQIPRTIECVSRPPGAEVLVDGEYRGKTPLLLDGIYQDSCEVLFRAEGRQAVTRTVEFDASRTTYLVEVDLPSLSEAYYLEEIARDPNQLANYVDLLHHYVLEKRYGKAAGTLETAVDLCMKRGLSAQAPRLWSEINRITVMQYDYGTAEDVATATKAVAASLEELLKRYPQGSPELLGEYVTALAYLGRRDEGRRILDDALRRYPSSQPLIDLRKQLHKQLYR